MRERRLNAVEVSLVMKSGGNDLASVSQTGNTENSTVNVVGGGRRVTLRHQGFMDLLSLVTYSATATPRPCTSRRCGAAGD